MVVAAVVVVVDVVVVPREVGLREGRLLQAGIGGLRCAAGVVMTALIVEGQLLQANRNRNEKRKNK